MSVAIDDRFARLRVAELTIASATEQTLRDLVLGEEQVSRGAPEHHTCFAVTAVLDPERGATTAEVTQAKSWPTGPAGLGFSRAS